MKYRKEMKEYNVIVWDEARQVIERKNFTYTDFESLYPNAFGIYAKNRAYKIYKKIKKMFL